MPDADRKTCKVVKRAGQRGARIAPKGCKVRTDISADGTTTERNKAGETKIRRTVADNAYFMTVAGANQQSIINGSAEGWYHNRPLCREHRGLF